MTIIDMIIPCKTLQWAFPKSHFKKFSPRNTILSGRPKNVL